MQCNAIQCCKYKCPLKQWTNKFKWSLTLFFLFLIGVGNNLECKQLIEFKMRKITLSVYKNCCYDFDVSDIFKSVQKKKKTTPANENHRINCKITLFWFPLRLRKGVRSVYDDQCKMYDWFHWMFFVFIFVRFSSFKIKL